MVTTMGAVIMHVVSAGFMIESASVAGGGGVPGGAALDVGARHHSESVPSLGGQLIMFVFLISSRNDRYCVIPSLTIN